MSLAQLGFELGMAVSEYNAGHVNTYETIIKFTMLYTEEVKRGLSIGNIREEELPEYYLVIGQAWASIAIK